MILKSQLANKLYLCAIKDNSADKKFVIYGTGPSAKELYEILMLFDIKAIFFIDEDNQVDVYENVDVYRPEDLIYFNTDNIFIISSKYNINFHNYIMPLFQSLGIKKEQIFHYNSNNLLFGGSRLIYDFMLMQNYTDKINGFTVYGDINNKNAKQIVALGGSTTFHYLMDGLKCWPEFLHETLDRNGHMTTVACGGMSGYVSGQELLKLYRDVFFSFNPSVVISFSGYNDLSVRYSDFYEREKRPYLPANYGMVFKELKINSDFMFLGLETDINIAQCWLMNMRLMKAMCDELNIKFLSFLQPCLITSEPSEENLSVLDKSRYDLDAIRFYYNELKNEIKNYDYIIDLTDIFVNDKNVFFDIVHVTDRGNANISNRIYSELAKRQLI